MSHSENKPKTTQTSQTSVQNLNVQDTEGVTLANSSGNTITVGDLGAIARAFDFGGDALRSNERALQEGADLAGRGLDSAMSFGKDAIDSVGSIASDAVRGAHDNLIEGFDFGLSALNAVKDTASDSIQAVGDAQNGVLDFALGIFNKSIGSNEYVVEKNLAGLGDLAKQTSASSDDRVTKVAGYALAAIAAAFILPAVLSKFK